MPRGGFQQGGIKFSWPGPSLDRPLSDSPAAGTQLGSGNLCDHDEEFLDLMKVLMLNSFDKWGGAARAAFRLNHGIKKLGVDSRLLVRFKDGNG